MASEPPFCEEQELGTSGCSRRPKIRSLCELVLSTNDTGIYEHDELTIVLSIVLILFATMQRL